MATLISSSVSLRLMVFDENDTRQGVKEVSFQNIHKLSLDENRRVTSFFIEYNSIRANKIRFICYLCKRQPPRQADYFGPGLIVLISAENKRIGDGSIELLEPLSGRGPHGIRCGFPCAVCQFPFSRLFFIYRIHKHLFAFIPFF